MTPKPKRPRRGHTKSLIAFNDTDVVMGMTPYKFASTKLRILFAEPVAKLVLEGPQAVMVDIDEQGYRKVELDDATSPDDYELHVDVGESMNDVAVMMYFPNAQWLGKQPDGISYIISNEPTVVQEPV